MLHHVSRFHLFTAEWQSIAFGFIMSLFDFSPVSKPIIFDFSCFSFVEVPVAGFGFVAVFSY
jgi:hypothetical protein